MQVGGAALHSDELAITLALQGAGERLTVPGGQVKALRVRTDRWGFSAQVEFWVSVETDGSAIVEAVQASELLGVELSIQAKKAPGQTQPPPLALKGIARSRSVAGRSYGKVGSAARTFHHCTLELGDPGTVLWRQHRPIELYTEATLADVLSAHKPEGMTLSMDWPVLTESRPMIFVGVGADHPRASFLDWIHWLVASQGGCLDVDSADGTWRFAAARAEGEAAAKLDPREVAEVQLVVPPLARHSRRVLNSYADGVATLTVEQAQAADPIRQDVLLRTQVSAEAEGRQSIEKERLVVRRAGLRVRLAGLPSVAVRPGSLVQIAGARWPSGLASSGDTTWRVVTLELEATALRPEPHAETQQPSAGYRLACTAHCEDQQETAVDVPPHRAPGYPAHVEGRVVSDSGEEGERTWTLAEDTQTGVLQWRVEVPLWSKTVSVPATPHEASGEFWFPPYKKERVLVALHFDRAELRRYLDWGEGARTPQEGQGDQLLLGKKPGNQTAITHDFADNKPVWNVARVNAKDTETMKMSEGNMLLLTKEEQ